MPKSSRAKIAIVGAGLSGTLAAIRLVNRLEDRAEIRLFERSGAFGAGLAYGKARQDDLLNVRAANMSAYPEHPTHFTDWLKTEYPEWGPQDFVPRRIYGTYLKSLLAHAARFGLRQIADRVLDMERHGSGFTLFLRSGLTFEADAVVLALGNAGPAPLKGLSAALESDTRLIQDPWTRSQKDDEERSASTARVLILGTGLTMVEEAIDMARRYPHAEIVALSRRGLFPQAHAAVTLPDRSVLLDDKGQLPARPLPLSKALKRLRDQIRKRSDWRGEIDALRPFTQGLWRSWSEAQRARFLRHLRPWWDIHRHRLAPQTATAFAELRTQDRVDVRAGRLISIDRTPDHLVVRYLPRGAHAVRSESFDRVLICTGPDRDLSRSGDDLIKSILTRGYAVQDRLGLGFETDARARLTGPELRGGLLFAIGPLSCGAFWEIVAVPDIRQQAQAVAATLHESLGLIGV